MIVKKDQTQLYRRIESLLESPNLFGLELSRAQQVSKGHGRLEHRRLVACSCPVGYLSCVGFPWARQVYRLRRRRVVISTGEVSEHLVYGVSSACADRLDADALLEHSRGHWVIENRSHYVRDVTFGEDGNRARVGSLPALLSGIRGLSLNLLRLAGVSNVAAALRRFAACPQEALALLQIRTE